MKINIWYMRSQRKLSVRQLADLTGISKTALNDYENEKVSPRMCDMEQIAMALNCKISDLFQSDYK